MVLVDRIVKRGERETVARIASLDYIIQCQSKWQIVYLIGELVCLRSEIKHSMVYLLV